MTSLLLEWVLAIVGSGGVGAALMFLATFKSKKRQENAAADSADIDNEQKKQNLKQDQCDYLQKTCDKYIKDYHDLEGDFRKQMSEIRELMDEIMREKALAIQAKCNEIAELKSKITYLKGIRCYNFTCCERIKENPDKTKE